MIANKLKVFRGFVIGFISLIVLFGILLVITHALLEKNVGILINADPDRAYDITYDELEFDPFLKGFEMENAQITPLQDETGTTITCHVELIRIRNLKWLKLLVNKRLVLSEMAFVRPNFTLFMGVENKDTVKSEKVVQQLFGDILSRVTLTGFKLKEGRFCVVNKKDSTKIGHIGRVNLEAKDIETDSVQWKYPIPLKLGEISMSIGDIMMQPDDYSTITCDSIKFDPKRSSLTIEGGSWKLNNNWIKVSESIGESTDIIEMDIKTIVVSDIGTNSQLYGDIDLRTQSILIDGLTIRDYRNKQLPRYDRNIQPLFSGLVDLIPFDLRVDTLQFVNLDVIYTELSKKRVEAGELSFNDLEGTIYNLTTIDSIQLRNKKFDLNVKGRINNAGTLNALISAPYNIDEFYMKGQVKSLDFKDLNSSLQPMGGLIAESGILYLLDIEMHANTRISKNTMIANYDSLKINLVEKSNEQLNKKILKSFAANTMVRKKNMPDNKNYIVAKYTTQRNAYRAPFNLMFMMLQEGLVQIFPTKTAKKLINLSEKKKKEKKDKK